MKDDILGGLDFAKMKEMQTFSDKTVDALRGTAITKFESSITMANAMTNFNSNIIGIQEQLSQIAINTIKELNKPLLESIGAMQCQARMVMDNICQNILGSINNDIMSAYEIIQNIYPIEIFDDEQQDIEEVDQKILTEICNEDNQKRSTKSSDVIIVASPINDQILKYLSENPEAFYQLHPGEFEDVMTEIYRKLGYDVERTKATRDGGKDIIIRKPSALGDFIYYVECKKYAPNRPIGLSIVKSMVGTINTDRVNGGIIATTSYFTRDSKKFILDNNLNYQVQMHDFARIQQLLKQVV